MAYSEAQKRATMKWDKENYDRVYLTVPNGMKQRIEVASKVQGYESVRAYIIDAINEKMEGKKMTISEKTKIAIDNSGKTYNAEELVFHTGEVVKYENEKYILIRQASPDNVLGEDVGCYSAPAVKIGDEVDEEGYCKRYTVAWKVLEDYDPEGQGEDCACDWDDPYEVFEVQAGQYNILTGEFF